METVQRFQKRLIGCFSWIFEILRLKYTLTKLFREYAYCLVMVIYMKYDSLKVLKLFLYVWWHCLCILICNFVCLSEDIVCVSLPHIWFVYLWTLFVCPHIKYCMFVWGHCLCVFISNFVCFFKDIVFVSWPQILFVSLRTLFCVVTSNIVCLFENIVSVSSPQFVLFLWGQC